MTEAPETRYAEQGEVRIAYQVIGDGPVDLLFVNSGQYPVDLIWEDPAASRFLRRIASFSRVVLFDMRGWGASGGYVTAAAPTVETWADDIGLLLDAVGLDRTAIFGFYVGAFCAMYYAAAHPERVSSLVLMEGFARIARDDDYPAGMPPRVIEAGTASYRDTYGTGDDISFYAPSRVNDAEFRRWWARCERLANTPLAAAEYWRGVTERDVRSVLPALRVPTLVLHRRDDSFIRVDHGRYLAAHIPGAKFVELDGADQMFFLGDADRVLDETELFLTGVRSGPELDRMLASVLFTDIVASTDRVVAMGDRLWRELLDRHDELTRTEVAKFRGRVVKSTGDGVLATFDGPARGIACAQALREGARSIGLELRAGLHTGEIERRGEDVGGIAVHLAARVLSMAQPGELLVSRTVTDLVAGSGLEFEDRGEHELKGIPGAWRLFSVSA
ncbi:MAG: adenylate/guanylate cyclase domain-containing protein [Acidimicrobiales bacterium]